MSLKTEKALDRSMKTGGMDEEDKYDPLEFRDFIVVGLNAAGSVVDAEEDKYDPLEFRDFIVLGLNAAGSDVDAVYKFLDSAGSKVDYRVYGDALFDILISGGLLVPGRSVAQDGDEICKTNACIFKASDDMASMRSFEQIFVKLISRYEYLEEVFVEEMKKVLMNIKEFTTSERMKLAKITALWIANSFILPDLLIVLLEKGLVKDSLALDFLLEVFVAWKQEKGLASMMASLEKSSLGRSLMDFVPPNKRNKEYLKTVFDIEGLQDVVKLYLAQESRGAKCRLERHLCWALADKTPIRNIISTARKMAAKANIPEHEVVILVWSAIMVRVEWNESEESSTDQLLKYLEQTTMLLAAFTQTRRSQFSLMLKVQEYCYVRMNFIEIFQHILSLFYKSDVIAEQVFEIFVNWYEEAHLLKEDWCDFLNRIIDINQPKKRIKTECNIVSLEEPGMVELMHLVRQPNSSENSNQVYNHLKKYPRLGKAAEDKYKQDKLAENS